MNKILLAFFYLSLVSSSFAQKAVYLDKKFKETVKPDAAYRRVTEPHPVAGLMLVKIYYIGGNLYSTASCKTPACISKEFLYEQFYENGNKKLSCNYENGKRTGIWTIWYENGNMKESKMYVNGRKEGFWKRWYENGSPKLEGRNLPKDDKLPDYRQYPVDNYWDVDGTQGVINGNGYATYYHKNLDTLLVSSAGSYKDGFKHGTWKGYSKLGKLKYEEKYNEEKVKGKSWDSSGNAYKYSEIHTPAVPKRGHAFFIEELKARLIYPLETKAKGIKGKVMVSFFVDKAGKITNVKAINDIGAGCAKAAEDAIRKCRDWEPETKRGQITVGKVVLPVYFR